MAQIAVALIASATFILTAYQSWRTAKLNSKTAEVLTDVRDALVAQSRPVVKFDQYQWFTNTEEVNCSTPAIGINVHFRNFSGVLVVIEASTLDIKLGDRPMFPNPPEVHERGGETILPPGVSQAIGRQGPAMQDVYKRLQGSGKPPYLNFDLRVTFRSLVSGSRYQYSGRVTLYHDCSRSHQSFHKIGPEAIPEISVRE